jgi:hypothetical protein
LLALVPLLVVLALGAQPGGLARARARARSGENLCDLPNCTDIVCRFFGFHAKKLSRRNRGNCLYQQPSFSPALLHFWSGSTRS